MKKSKEIPKRLIAPGPEGWRVWNFQGQTPSLAQEAAALPIEWAGPRSLLAVPVRYVFCLPLRLATEDASLFPNLSRMQAEAAGIWSDGTPPPDFRAVSRENGSTAGIALALSPSLPEDMARFDSEAFSLSADLYDFPADRAVLWREQGRLMVVITHGNRPAYFQCLADAELSDAVIGELECLRHAPALQNLNFNWRGIVIWRETEEGFEPEQLARLGKALGCAVKLEQMPLPRWPAASTQALQPPEVKSLHHTRAGKKKIRRLIAIAVALYVAALLAFIGSTVWYGWQKEQLIKEIAQISAPAEGLRDVAQRWQAMGPALHRDLFPLETLKHCAEALPPEGARLTLFDLAGEKLVLTGESHDATTAFSYKTSLTQALSSHGWTLTMPQPRLLPNGSAQFQLEGDRATTNSN